MKTRLPIVAFIILLLFASQYLSPVRAAEEPSLAEIEEVIRLQEERARNAEIQVRSLEETIAYCEKNLKDYERMRPILEKLQEREEQLGLDRLSGRDRLFAIGKLQTEFLSYDDERCYRHDGRHVIGYRGFKEVIADAERSRAALGGLRNHLYDAATELSKIKSELHALQEEHAPRRGRVHLEGPWTFSGNPSIITVVYDETYHYFQGILTKDHEIKDFNQGDLVFQVTIPDVSRPYYFTGWERVRDPADEKKSLNLSITVDGDRMVYRTEKQVLELVRANRSPRR